MGASDAINALRSEAVAKTAQSNVLSEGISNTSSEAQKVSGTVRQAKSNAMSKLLQENGSVDQYRMSIRQSTRSAGDATIGLVFSIINAAFSSSTSALNIAVDTASVCLDVATIVQDMFLRDRHMTNLQIQGTYASLYSPGIGITS